MATQEEGESAAGVVQEVADAVAATHPDQGPDYVFAALKSELAKRALTQQVPNEALHKYALAISEGHPVTVDPADLEEQA